MYNHLCMKTQIIQIEPFDSLESLIDRIESTDTARVLLLDHSDNDITRSEVKTNRLIRSCQSSGKQIGLVTENKHTFSLWKERGFPVFPDVVTAEQETWGTVRFSEMQTLVQELTGQNGKLPHLEKPSQGKPLPQPVRKLIFSIAILAVVILAAVIFPSTSITIYLPRTEAEEVYQVRVSEKYTETGISGQIPAVAHRENYSLVKSIPASGTGIFPVERAGGQVEFRNLTEQKVVIPKGTRVSTGGVDPILFVTLEECVLDGRVNARITVNVQAVQPGTGGNVPAEAVKQVEDALGVRVLVDNPEAFNGGTDVEKSVPTAGDRAALIKQVEEEREKYVTEKIQSTIGLQQYLVTGSFTVLDGAQENFYPQEGEPGENLTLEVSGTARVLVVNQAEILAYIQDIADADPNRSRQVLSDSIQIEKIRENGQQGAGTYLLDVVTRQTTIPRIRLSDWSYSLTGKPVSEAINILNARLDTARSSTVQNHPSWWPWTAMIPMRITVEVK